MVILYHWTIHIGFRPERDGRPHSYSVIPVVSFLRFGPRRSIPFDGSHWATSSSNRSTRKSNLLDRYSSLVASFEYYVPGRHRQRRGRLHGFCRKKAGTLLSRTLYSLSHLCPIADEEMGDQNLDRLEDKDTLLHLHWLESRWLSL